MRKCLVLFTMLSAATIACAQCGSNECAVEDWKEIEGDPGRVYLYRNGKQIGGWDYDAGHWRSYDAQADRWSEPASSPPSVPPARRLLNYGVDASKLGSSTCQLNGRRATRQEIDAAIGNQLPDDTKKFRLVASGNDAERKRITDAWQAVEPETKARVALWSVPANHWSLQDATTGKTMFRVGGITFLAPDGRVLHRQGDFAGTEDFAAIRKAIRSYDADKDPDLRKSAPAPAPPVPTNNVYVWLALGAIAGFNYFLRKRGS